MNVRPGQLARCISGEFFGEVCEVIEAAPPEFYKPTQQWMDGWHVRFPFPMPWAFVPAGHAAPLTDGWYPDAWLRPLDFGAPSGSDERDATLTPRKQVENAR